MDVELATRYGQANQGSMDVAGRFGRKSNWMFVIIGASLLMITLMRFKPLCPDEVFAAGYGADSFPDRALLRTVDEDMCKIWENGQVTLYRQIFDTAEGAKLTNNWNYAGGDKAVPFTVCSYIMGFTILRPQCCAFAVAADADQSNSLEESEFKTFRRLLIRYKALIEVYLKCSGFGFRQCEAAGNMEKISETVRAVFYDLDKNKDNWLEQRELEGIFAAFGSAVSSPKTGWAERTFYNKVMHFTRSYPFLLDKDHNGVLDSKEINLVNYFFITKATAVAKPDAVEKPKEHDRCKNLVLWVSRVATLPKLVSLDAVCDKYKDPETVLRKTGVLSCYENSCLNKPPPS